MMRVAVVIDSLKVGGAQKLISAYAAHAAAHDLLPVVITLREDNAPFIVDSIHAAGIKLIHLPQASLFSLRRFQQLVKLLHDEQVELVQTHLTYANILGCLAAHSDGIPVIATLHSITVRTGWKARVLRVIENFLLRRYATRILAVGQMVADANRRSFGNRKLDVIPNGIPRPQFPSRQEQERLRREITGEAAGSIVITVGRFTRAKGYEDMIEAFRLLQKMAAKPTLVMVGAGTTVDTIRDRIADLDLDQSIILTGEREDVPSLLALSDVYASSSHREGLPLAVLEAMMAGLPVVATSVGDIPAVVTKETGVVVPPHHPELLADALEDLLKHPQKREAMGQAAYRRAMTEYSVDAWMKKHMTLYRQVLSNGHGSDDENP
jgi:glycosyltransferase involved in cell wall biosynthesis